MKRDLFALGLVFTVILIFGQSIVIHQQSPFGGDIPLQFFPWKCYTRAMLSSGEIPYWNPYTHGGAPFLANMQSAVFYPLDLLLFLFPMEYFYGLSLLLHLWVAGAGAYFLARICGASAFPAMIAGIAYGLNGFTMIHIPAGNHLTYAGAAWVPWMLWAAVGFVRATGSRLPWALGGALISCLHFLCGHPQIMFYSLVFSFFLCLFLGLWMEKQKSKPNWFVPCLRTTAFSIFLVLGIGMAGAQLIPTLQYIGLANRASSIGLQAATEFSFAPHRLIALLCPDFFGSMIRGTHYDSFVYWSNAYAGVMVPILAFYLLLRSPKRYPAALPLAVVALLGLLFAWGRGNPFYSMIYQLPGFGYFRAPAKYLPYYLAPVCTLAALGVESLSARTFDLLRREPLEPQQKKIRWLKADLFIFILLVLLAYLANPLLTGLRSQETLSLTKIYFHIAPVFNDPVAQVRFVERMGSMYRLVFLLILGWIAWKAGRLVPQNPRFVLSILFSFVLSIDLISYGWNYLNPSLVSAETIRQSILTPPSLGGMRSPRQSPRPDRMMNLRDVDMPDVFMHWRAYNIAGYDPMTLKTYYRQMSELENWPSGEYHDNIQLTRTDHPVLDLLNVRYVVTRQKIEAPGLELLPSSHAFNVYRRNSPSCAWAMRENSSGQWRPADDLVQFRVYEPQRIVFQMQTQEALRMRVAEWDYPNWRAQAIGANESTQSVSIESSSEGLRILAVPAGTHEIRMEYHASMSGWLLSGCCFMLFGLLLLLAILVRTDRVLSFLQRTMGRDF